MNYPTKSSSQEYDDHIISKQNLTINDFSKDNLNHDTLSVKQDSIDNFPLVSNIHSEEQILSRNILNSISVIKNVYNVNRECDSTTKNILTSKDNNSTDELSTENYLNKFSKYTTKSPKSERSRKRKLTHSLSDSLKLKSTSNKPHAQLAYCTRNKNINGRSPIRIVSTSECSNSNIYEVKVEDKAKCSDTNIIRIPSLSTIISEPEQKSFAENITSTSNSSSLNENSPVLNNKALLFANNSSRHLKNKSSSIFPGISTETAV